MSCGSCHKLSPAFLLSSWFFLVVPRSPWHPSMRCSESEDSSELNSENLFLQQPVFILSLRVFLLCSMYCTLSSTVCMCKPCQQSKPHQLWQTFFFAGSWPPFAHACKARPLTIVGLSSLSVIVIVSQRSMFQNCLWSSLFADSVHQVTHCWFPICADHTFVVVTKLVDVTQILQQKLHKHLSEEQRMLTDHSTSCPWPPKPWPCFREHTEHKDTNTLRLSHRKVPRERQLSTMVHESVVVSSTVSQEASLEQACWQRLPDRGFQTYPLVWVPLAFRGALGRRTGVHKDSFRLPSVRQSTTVSLTWLSLPMPLQASSCRCTYPSTHMTCSVTFPHPSSSAQNSSLLLRLILQIDRQVEPKLRFGTVVCQQVWTVLHAGDVQHNKVAFFSLYPQRLDVQMFHSSCSLPLHHSFCCWCWPHGR